MPALHALKKWVGTSNPLAPLGSAHQNPTMLVSVLKIFEIFKGLF
jgi:hypothetical protein